MKQEFDLDKRKMLSALSHASIFISSLVFSIGIPIAVLFISDDPIVKENAKEAINFHLNVWVYGFIIGILCFLLIGYLLLIPFFLFHWGLALWATISTLQNTDRPFRYPFIFRIM